MAELWAALLAAWTRGNAPRQRQGAQREQTQQEGNNEMVVDKCFEKLLNGKDVAPFLKSDI